MNFRTDLADERREVFRKINKLSQEIPGIESEEKEISDTIKVHKVKVTNNEGEQALQKPIGTYVTIDVKKMKNIPEEEKEKIAFTISGELQEMIKIINRSYKMLQIEITKIAKNFSPNFRYFST